MIDKIGTTAGEIWRFLDERKDRVSIINLKMSLSLPNSAIYLAIGWLARENKITLIEENNEIFVQLKK